VTEHRAELATAGTASATARDTVANLNVPNCATGVVRGERKLASEVNLASMSTALARQNCASTATPNDEIGAFNAGFATLTEVPATPAS
jgi:5'-nucleotidase